MLCLNNKLIIPLDSISNYIIRRQINDRTTRDIWYVIWAGMWRQAENRIGSQILGNITNNSHANLK